MSNVCALKRKPDNSWSLLIKLDEAAWNLHDGGIEANDVTGSLGKEKMLEVRDGQKENQKESNVIDSCK